MNSTEQAPAERVQVAAELNVPPGELKETFPVGVMVVPAPVESETVAVQVVGTLTGTEDEAQFSVVELSR